MLGEIVNRSIVKPRREEIPGAAIFEHDLGVVLVAQARGSSRSSKGKGFGMQGLFPGRRARRVGSTVPLGPPVLLLRGLKYLKGAWNAWYMAWKSSMKLQMS